MIKRFKQEIAEIAHGQTDGHTHDATKRIISPATRSIITLGNLVIMQRLTRHSYVNHNVRRQMAGVQRRNVVLPIAEVMLGKRVGNGARGQTASCRIQTS